MVKRVHSPQFGPQKSPQSVDYHPNPIRGVCCICGTVYREGITAGGQVSHGFCAACYEKELERLRSKLLR